MKKTVVIFYFFFFTAICFGTEPDALFDSAGNAYSSGNFQKASEYYESILSQGFESPEVYFNLGNAYFKIDRIGLSVLNYERAKKLLPHDDDIQYNLNLANQRTVDKIESSPKFFFGEWWENLKNLRSEKTWTLRSIFCFTLFLVFLAVFIVSKKAINRQVGFWFGVIFLLLAVSTFIIAEDRYRELSKKDTAVILVSSAEIKNAPAESGIKLFILHEGTKVNTIETNGDWVKIGLSQEKVGWIKKTAIEFI